MKSASEILNDYMVKNSISQHQLASTIGSSQVYIGKILKREFFMSTKKAILIEQYTGLSARELLIADIDYKLYSSKKK